VTLRAVTIIYLI